MISFVLTSVVEISSLTLRYTYSWGRYFIYGKEPSIEDKLNQLLEDNKAIRLELSELKNKDEQKNDVPSYRKEVHQSQ